MISQMTGANEKDGAITCKLSNDCIRPFLSIGAVSESDCSISCKKVSLAVLRI